MELALVPGQQGNSSSQGGEEPKLLPCTVPAQPGSRLSFSWGAGCQLHVAEVASGTAGGRQPFAGSCEWTGLSSAQRRVAYQVLPIYTALQQNLIIASEWRERHA